MPSDHEFVLNKADGRSRVEHEDGLISSRVSSFVGSQSFLFAAYVLLISNKEYFVSVVPEYAAAVHATIFFLVVIGLTVSICSTCAVLAAFAAIRRWIDHVDPATDRPGLKSNAMIHHLGGLPAIVPGPVLVCIWIEIAVSRWNDIWALPIGYLVPPLGTAALILLIWFGFNWKVASR